MKETEFREIQSAGAKIISVFSADWCGPCRMFEPIFQDTSSKLPEFKFAKINVDECRDLSAEYHISSVPTIIIFEGNKVVKERTGGFASAEQFEKWIKG
ncbi:MAG: thioredoxin family protein [Firmicutes bacterium]|nr:thioredoxin family protein [Bacillota bacterium]